jgi:predicted alpha/beta hydrolase family esterase
MRFLILHGLGGSGPEHWQSWLADRLREDGRPVDYPALPDPHHPELEAWLGELDALRAPGQVVICHSLACCLWLHHRARGGPPAERVLFVAPACPEPMLPEIAGFFPVPLEPALADGARVACSDADPYCPAGAAAVFAAPLGLAVDLLPGALHVNPESGYGPWPAALAWAQGAKNGVET